MMQKISHFILYNNFVPIMLGILFLGAGATFAASPEVRDAVISSERVLKSIDNSHIVATDLESRSFDIRITEVTEDSENYFVAYEFATIDLIDGVWRDVTQEKSLIVSKALLGGQDLGVYVSEELAEIRDAEKVRLVETQRFERGKGETHKVVSTVYRGLVGRILSPKDETFEGYTPVVKQQVAAVAHTSESAGGIVNTSTTQSGGFGPTLVLIGNNPATLPLGARYADPGAIFENPNDNYTIHTFLDSEPVQQVLLDTSTSSTYIIRYEATNQAGQTGFIERTVIVGDGGVTENTSEITEPKSTSTTTSQQSPETESVTPVETTTTEQSSTETTTNVSTTTTSSSTSTSPTEITTEEATTTNSTATTTDVVVE